MTFLEPKHYYSGIYYSRIKKETIVCSVHKPADSAPTEGWINDFIIIDGITTKGSVNKMVLKVSATEEEVQLKVIRMMSDALFNVYQQSKSRIDYIPVYGDVHQVVDALSKTTKPNIPPWLRYLKL